MLQTNVKSQYNNNYPKQQQFEIFLKIGNMILRTATNETF